MGTVFDDDADLFLDDGLMSEPVVLVLGPENTRNVNAIVDRYPPRVDPISDKRIQKQAILTLSAKAGNGITPSEIVFGRLAIRFSLDRPGGPVGEYLAQIPDDGRPWADDSMVRLQVR